MRRGGVIEATFDENHERLTGTLKQGFFEFALELTREAADTPRPRADPASAFGRWAEASWMIRRHVGPRWVLAGGNPLERIAATRSIELVVHDGRLHRPGSTPASD